jgi:hypothetical protein
MAIQPKSYSKSAASNSGSSFKKKDDFVPGKPVYTIKVKQGDEFVQLCNLFENKTKTGETFYKGVQKDEKGDAIAQFFVMPITPKENR